MKSQLKKVAVVTGSSKGIGKAIAIRLAKDGYFVYVTYHTDINGGLDVVNQITKNGGQASLHKLDVSNEDSVIKLMDSIEKEFHYLDVLVNNAEKDVSKNIEESSFEEWQLAFNTKIHGAWLSTKYAIPLLKKSENANIVIVSSSADERPSPEILSYAVATGATNSFMKAIAIYLSKYKIRVNAVMPGQVRTANWGKLEKDDALWKSFAKNNPLKRVATTEDIADAVMILVNDPHKFLNGNFFFVNGGNHLQ